MLAGVGSYFSWQAVVEIQAALAQPGLSSEQKQALHVDLALGITSALLSTGLTLTASVALIAGGLSALGVSSAALTAVAAAAGLAGPLMGAALIGIFVAQWVIAGVRVVKEVEKYTDLTGLERFEVGLGAMFGLKPADVSIRYEYEKLLEQLHAKKMDEITSAGIQHPLTDFYGDIETLKVIPGQEISKKVEWYHYLPFGFIDLLLPNDVTSPQTRYHFGTIDLNHAEFKSDHPDNGSWTAEERERRMHHRYDGKMPEKFKPQLIGLLTVCNPARVTYKGPDRFELSFPHLPNNKRVDSSGKIYYETSSLSKQLHQKYFNNESHRHDYGRKGQPHTAYGGKPDTEGLRDKNVETVYYGGDLNGDGIEDALSLSTNGTMIARISGKKSLSRGRVVPQTLLKALLDMEDQTAYLFLHDINNDKKSDLVAVGNKGKVHVALSKGDGRFSAEVTQWVMQGSHGKEDAIVSNKALILGFIPGSNRILSWHPRENHEGELYANLIVQEAGIERHRRLSYVNFARKSLAQSGTDSFIARQGGEQDVEEYVINVYDTQSQNFVGGDKNDQFIFHISENTRFLSPATSIPKNWLFSDKIVLNGREGNDHIRFLPAEGRQQGVVAHLGEQMDSDQSAVLLIDYDVSGTRHYQRVQFIGIEKMTGTSYNDTLSSNMQQSVTLDGQEGEDVLTSGTGNDTLIIERGKAEGGAGKDTYILLKSKQAGLLTIRENPAGEESTIFLTGALSQIQQIYQQGEDLCLDLDNGNSTARTVKLADFYRQRSPNENASRYAIHSDDGFSFQLVAGTKVRGTRIKKEREFLKSNRFEKIMILMNKYNGDVEQDDVATMLRADSTPKCNAKPPFLTLQIPPRVV